MSVYMDGQHLRQGTYKQKGNISVSMVTKIRWQTTKQIDYGVLVTELVIMNIFIITCISNIGEYIALGFHPLN